MQIVENTPGIRVTSSFTQSLCFSDYHEDERAFEKLNSRLYPSNLITIEGRRKTGVSYY